MGTMPAAKDDEDDDRPRGKGKPLHQQAGGAKAGGFTRAGGLDGLKGPSKGEGASTIDTRRAARATRQPCRTSRG